MSKNNKNKLVPRLRFPEFQNAGEWEVKRLGEVLEKNKEKNKEGKYTLVQSVSNKFGFINQDDFFDNRIVASKDKSNYYVIRKGCFAYNPSRIDVGSLAYKYDDNVSIISPLYISFRANHQKINDLFLLNWLKSERFNKQMILEGGVRNTLNYDNLIEILIPLPSLPEQQKIASCLSSLDELIEAESQKLELYQQHKKGLLQNLFPNSLNCDSSDSYDEHDSKNQGNQENHKNQGSDNVPKLRFKEFENSGEWEVKELKNVSEVVMGSSPSSSSYNENKVGLPLIQGNADIKNRKSVPRIYTSEVTKVCQIGDILLSVRAPVGTVAKSLHKACIGRGIAAIRATDKNSQEFLYQWLISNESSWQNISQGGTFDAVNSDDVRNLLLPIPKLPEQQKIAACLLSLDDLINAQRQKIELLQQHKKGLMQGLFPNVNDGYDG